MAGILRKRRRRDRGRGRENERNHERNKKCRGSRPRSSRDIRQIRARSSERKKNKGGTYKIESKGLHNTRCELGPTIHRTKTRRNPQGTRKSRFCFVLFCLPCNSQCACGGMTTAETTFPPSNLALCPLHSRCVPYCYGLSGQALTSHQYLFELSATAEGWGARGCQWGTSGGRHRWSAPKNSGCQPYARHRRPTIMAYTAVPQLSYCFGSCRPRPTKGLHDSWACIAHSYHAHGASCAQECC